jgi:hypothetical protein
LLTRRFEMDQLRAAIIPPEMTKHAIQEAGLAYAGSLLDRGDDSILDAYMRLRALRDAVASALKELEGDAIDEAEAYLPGERVHLGVKFQVRAGRPQYDFSQDSAWQELKQQEARIAGERKQRETFLKALTSEVYDPATGEIVAPIGEPVKYGKAVLALTFPQ